MSYPSRRYNVYGRWAPAPARRADAGQATDANIAAALAKIERHFGKPDRPQ